MSNLISKAAVLCCLFAAALSAHAQSRQISGKVMDSQGGPLPAAAVYEQGNMVNGTITDAEGNYKVSVRSSQSVLVFSCLGFSDKNVPVGENNVINVNLEDDSTILEGAEVVSVGYGTVAKRDLTGSVSSVSMDVVTKTPVTNFDLALEGRVAGVNVSTSDGQVGSVASITIRGNNSLTQSSEPLYVIDGFLSESSMAASINPADIESLDILKDASATAIYGARGANGVVVIQTKSGIEGRPKVDFSTSLSCSTIARKMDLMGGYDFVELQSEIYDITQRTNIYLNDGYTLEDYRNAPSVDWQDKVYRPAVTSNTSVSLSGGSKESGTTYNVSLSALDQNGIIRNSNFQKYQGKVNFSQKLGKKVKFDAIVNYTRSITNGSTPTTAQTTSSASGWLMYSIWGYRPVMPLSSTDPNWADELTDTEFASSNDYRFNPAKSVANEYRKTIVDYVSANGAITWTIIDGLVFKASAGYSLNDRRREEFNGSQTYTGYVGSPSGKGINGGIYWTSNRSWQNDYTLTYRKAIARNHHTTSMVGFAMQGQSLNYKGTASTNMTTESLGLNGLHTGMYQTVTPYQYDWRMMSAFLRLNYDYKYKYYLTATFRADGSSKFPANNRWGFFPSASAAWNFGREDFLKDSGVVSNGKLRLSYGMTGNNRTTTPYDYYSQITTAPGSTSSFDYVFDGSHIAGYYPVNMANDKLKWETTAQWDAGLDLGFLDNRIKMVFDWYLKDTRDLLLQATIPASSGYTSAMLNIGSMRNTGVEFTIDAVPVRTRNFEWNLNLNIAANRNQVTALSGDQHSLLSSVTWEQRFNSQYPYITQVGKPTGMFYGYIYDGTYKSEDFTSEGLLKDGIAYIASDGRQKMQPGDARYRDINEDGVIDDNDRTIIGCGQPLFTGGFSTSLNYKGFDFNVFFNFSYGNQILNANRLFFENAQSPGLNQLSSYKNHFKAGVNESDIPRIGANGAYLYSSRVVEDGSYLRVKNISLGYSLPRKVLKKMHFDKFRVYVSLDNIATITGYSGPDPEVSTRNSVLTPGFDWSAYPRAMGGSLGINMTF